MGAEQSYVLKYGDNNQFEYYGNHDPIEYVKKIKNDFFINTENLYNDNSAQEDASKFDVSNITNSLKFLKKYFPEFLIPENYISIPGINNKYDIYINPVVFNREFNYYYKVMDKIINKYDKNIDKKIKENLKNALLKAFPNDNEIEYKGFRTIINNYEQSKIFNGGKVKKNKQIKKSKKSKKSRKH